MASNLVIFVHLHDRFHGMALRNPEWPPSPARLFQALVAGAAWGGKLPKKVEEGLLWLERLPPPRIGEPRSRPGRQVTLFVPNNDLDAKGGDPANVGSIRTKKVVEPRILEDDTPLLYVWSFEEGKEYAEALLSAADGLYQLGRGIDMAWARGEICNDEELHDLLVRYPGTLLSPEVDTRRGSTLLCPVGGSLSSLHARFLAPKLASGMSGRKAIQIFQNPPKPLFRLVGYGRRRRLKVFQLQRVGKGSSAFWELREAAPFVERIRDRAAEKLLAQLPELEDEIERILIGRKPDGRDGGPIEERVRIIPLPSIGHPEADQAIRRVVVDIPNGSRLDPDDVAWAFDGLALSNEAVLVPEPESPMLGHYSWPARRFRTVTPAALPEVAARRRIDPTKKKEAAKGAGERIAEEQRAKTAVEQALRHAGIHAQVASIWVQREPFERRGLRAEKFAEGTRFSKHRLWHVEVEFEDDLTGPLVLGDGRFLGLGVMRPWASSSLDIGIWGFRPIGDMVTETPALLVQAFRRAVMARVSEAQRIGRELDAFFTGHGEGGEPVRTVLSSHLSFQWDPGSKVLLVIAPHRLDGREPEAREKRLLRRLDRALKEFSDLRAGRAGRFELKAIAGEDVAAYLRSARNFLSANPYRVTRHGKKIDAHTLLVVDIQVECRRRGIPVPRVTVLEAKGVPGVGLVGTARLEFPKPVKGPVVLGRDRFLGGGLFVPDEETKSIGR